MAADSTQPWTVHDGKFFANHVLDGSPRAPTERRLVAVHGVLGEHLLRDPVQRRVNDRSRGPGRRGGR